MLIELLAKRAANNAFRERESFEVQPLGLKRATLSLAKLASFVRAASGKFVFLPCIDRCFIHRSSPQSEQRSRKY